MSTSTNPKPTILLVHGAWHTSTCWDTFLPYLSSLGYPTETVDLPCTASIRGSTQFDDATAVRNAVEALLLASKRVVVLAHSYGGQPGSAGLVGLSPASLQSGSLLGLIKLAAYLLPGGLDQGAAIDELGGLPYANWDTPSEGLFTVKDEDTARQMFYEPDVPKHLADQAVKKLQPQSTASNRGFVPPQIWEDADYKGGLAYIRTTADGIVPVGQQDAMIDGAGRERWIVRSLEGSGHSPFLSRPGELAEVVDDIVQGFERGEGRGAPPQKKAAEGAMADTLSKFK